MTDTERLNWLEEQAEHGACIGLINDDNGHWAVSGPRAQNCPESGDPQDIDTTFFVFAEEWKNSIREAIDAVMEGKL
jgi:hypothetical protein